jgi:hypothetical protein
MYRAGIMIVVIVPIIVRDKNSTSDIDATENASATIHPHAMAFELNEQWKEGCKVISEMGYPPTT